MKRSARPKAASISRKKSENPAKNLGGIKELALEKINENTTLDLSGLVDELTHDLGYDRDRILARLMELENDGNIKIQEKNPYRSFASYVSSPVSLWFWTAIVATLLSFALVYVTSGVALYLRFLFGGLLILFLPGFSLIQYLYAKKEELDGLTRLALSIGLSLAIVPLVGLALNYTPFGIRLIPVEISLMLFTVILLVLALKKKHSYYKLAKDIV